MTGRAADDRRAGLLVLLSGGASALWCAPAEGLGLDDKQSTSEWLLRAGDPQVELAAPRDHVSQHDIDRVPRLARPVRHRLAQPHAMPATASGFILKWTTTSMKIKAGQVAQ